MDFEGIFPLIVIVIIWVVSNVFRKISKVDQGRPAFGGQRPGILQILQKKLAALEERAQGGEIIDIAEYFQPPPQNRGDEHELKSLIEIAEDSLPREPPIIGRKKSPVPPPAKVVVSRPAMLQEAKPVARMTRRKLQNVVLWAEILAPPVALRHQ